MKYMRITAGYTWKTNKQIAYELKITPVWDKLLEYKRKWIQHVNRMPRNGLPRVMKHYSPSGRRNHGRPLMRLRDTWDRNGSTSGPTPWKMHDDDGDDDDDDLYLVWLNNCWANRRRASLFRGVSRFVYDSCQYGGTTGNLQGIRVWSWLCAESDRRIRKGFMLHKRNWLNDHDPWQRMIIVKWNDCQELGACIYYAFGIS